MGVHIQYLWEKVAERNSFGEKEPFVRACGYKEAAAALGAALKVTETFVSQI